MKKRAKKQNSKRKQKQQKLKEIVEYTFNKQMLVQHASTLNAVTCNWNKFRNCLQWCSSSAQFSPINKEIFQISWILQTHPDKIQ